MSIVVNGTRVDCEQGATLALLLRQLGLPANAVLVEHNQAAVPRAAFAEVPLTENDVIEVVQMAAGG
ncbi:MAG TPA: sulfur carrier protein ThiS [Chthoniobacterales bacterium]